jgi:hypothetical protein
VVEAPAVSAANVAAMLTLRRKASYAAAWDWATHDSAIKCFVQGARFVNPEESHLHGRLSALLALRRRYIVETRIGVAGVGMAQENRRMIRDCITRLRQARAGVPALFLGLGQREVKRRA